MGARLEPPWVPRALLRGRGTGSHRGSETRAAGLSLTSHRGRSLTFPWTVLTSTPSKRRVLTDTDAPLGGTNPQVKVQVPLRRLAWDAAFLTSHRSDYT